MPAHVQISFQRTHGVELGQQAAVCWNADRHSAGEGASQGGAAAVDYDTPISDRLAIWPPGGKCGLGLGRLGFRSLGMGQLHGPANWGLGFGYLGLGELGIYGDYWRWDTSKAHPPLEGLRDGPYRFGMSLSDGVGNEASNPGSECTIVVKNVPRPPRYLTSAAGSASLTLSWTRSRDVGS